MSQGWMGIGLMVADMDSEEPGGNRGMTKYSTGWSLPTHRGPRFRFNGGWEIPFYSSPYLSFGRCSASWTPKLDLSFELRKEPCSRYLASIFSITEAKSSFE